jgi:hypothetical protein
MRTGEALPADPSATRDVRNEVYILLTLVAVSIVGARIATAPSRFSNNDASRWATVRALVDTGSYAIGSREQLPDGTHHDVGIVAETEWGTIDLVMDPGTRQFYSSKPALLPTVLAGEYWLLRHVLSLEFDRHRLAVARTILMTINLIPFALYLIVLARLVERVGTTDWGRLFVFTAAAFGTFISGYLGSLNNHTVAAMGTLFAVYHGLRIHLDDDRRWWRFMLAGAFAGWTFGNELPAGAFALGLLVWLARLAPRQTLRFAVPGVLVPAAALAWTQYLAIGTPLPTYAQAAWYEFAGSYWLNPGNIDLADEPKLLYAANLLVGHTGILSLTPVLVLGWIGMVRTATGSPAMTPSRSAARALAALTLTLTLVTFAFYVFRTEAYGGKTVGPRWFFWLVPLWLLTMLPEADRWASRRRLRLVAGVLLVISIATASFALANPWQWSPLLIVFRRLGLVSY